MRRASTHARPQADHQDWNGRDRDVDVALPDLDPEMFDAGVLRLAVRAVRAFGACHQGQGSLAGVEIVAFVEFICSHHFKHSYRRLDSGFHRLSYRQITVTLTPDLEVVSAYANRTGELPSVVCGSGELLDLFEVADWLDPLYVRVSHSALRAFANIWLNGETAGAMDELREVLEVDWEDGEWSREDATGTARGDRYYLRGNGRRWIIGAEDGVVISVAGPAPEVAVVPAWRSWLSRLT